MKIVIAGCGWLGMKLAEILQANGHSVTGTRRSIPESDRQVPFITYDPGIPVDEAAKKAFAEADIVVLSFPPDRSYKEKYAEDCLRTVKLCGDEARILMISSTSVYPDVEAMLTEEDTEDDSSNTILSAEKALAGFAGNRLTIIRMAGLFGENRMIVTHMSKSGKTYPANEPVNLIHRDDAARICLFVIENNINGEIFNACAAKHPGKEAFYTWLAGKLAISPPKFEKSGSGKIIGTEKSRKAGYTYLKDDPYDFL